MKSKRNCRTFTFGSVICVIALVIYLFSQTIMVASAAVMPVGSIAVVTADTKLNLREEPQGKIIGKLARGKEVTILSEIDRDGYYRIRVNENGLECYAYGEYLEFLYDGNASQETIYSIPEQDTIYTEESTYSYEEDDCITIPEGTVLVVNSNGKLNMRKKPSKKENRIQYLYDGELLEVVSSNVKNNYVLVRDYNDGKVGYVSLDYVKIWGEHNLDKKECSPENCCQNCICQFCR